MQRLSPPYMKTEKKTNPISAKLGNFRIYLLYSWFERFNPITNTVMNKTTRHTMEYIHDSAAFICAKHTKSIAAYLVDIFIECIHFSLSIGQTFCTFQWMISFTHIYFVGFCGFVCEFVCLMVCVHLNNLYTWPLQN